MTKAVTCTVIPLEVAVVGLAQISAEGVKIHVMTSLFAKSVLE